VAVESKTQSEGNGEQIGLRTRPLPALAEHAELLYSGSK
jgi:hypothetical protein